MEDKEIIRIEGAKWGDMEVIFNLPKAQLAIAVAGMNKEQLADSIREWNITVPELLDMILYDWTGKGNNLDDIPTDVMERLVKLANEHKESGPSRLEDAVRQNNLATIAWNADHMSDKELEAQLRNIGLLQHSSNLMR